MARFLTQFVNKNKDKIDYNAVDGSRVLNDLGKNQHLIPAALNQAFRNKMPTQLFKDSFYQEYKEFLERKEAIQNNSELNAVEKNSKINQELTLLLKQHDNGLFGLYHLIIASTYGEIYEGNSYTSDDALKPLFKTMLEQVSKTSNIPINHVAGKLLFSVAANISDIAGTVAAALSDEAEKIMQMTDQEGNPFDPEGEIFATLNADIINYIGTLGGRLQTIEDIQAFLTIHQDETTKLELAMFNLQREINYGRYSEKLTQTAEKSLKILSGLHGKVNHEKLADAAESCTAILQSKNQAALETFNKTLGDLGKNVIAKSADHAGKHAYISSEKLAVIATKSTKIAIQKLGLFSKSHKKEAAPTPSDKPTPKA